MISNDKIPLLFLAAYTHPQSMCLHKLYLKVEGAMKPSEMRFAAEYIIEISLFDFGMTAIATTTINNAIRIDNISLLPNTLFRIALILQLTGWFCLITL